MKANIFSREVPIGSCMFFETRTHSFKSQWHSHPEYELVFIKEGHGILKYGSAIIEYTPQDLFLFAPWIPHEFIEKSQNHHSISSIFHAEILSLPSFHCSMSTQINKILELSLNGIKFPKSKNTELFFTNTLLKQGLEQTIELILFIVYLGKYKDNIYKITDINNPQDNLSIKRYAQIHNILKYINDYIDQDITIDKLAKRFFISRSSLSRLFSSILQTGVLQYITQQRLSYACRLLATTNIPITKISEKTGFKSISSFNRSFLKYKKIPPRQYRKNNIR